MEPISMDVALKFCEVCDKVYEAWVTHAGLFDKNETPEKDMEKLPTAFTNRLSIITQEYALQQIAKLHDPAIQQGSINLTVDYMIRFGDWGEQSEAVSAAHSTLQDLWKSIKPARNKLLAHNDLEALMVGEALGAFPKGKDDEYFDALQELVNMVHDKWVGGPYPFNDLAKADVYEFLAMLERQMA